MIVFVLRHSFSKGVVFLDQSGVGLDLVKKFRSWTKVQNGKDSIFSLEAKLACDKRCFPSKKCWALTVW